MTENKIGALVCLLFLSFTLLACPAKGQDARKVPISFLPPPLETATFSLGIYDSKTGKLVRRLKEAATQDAFTVGLNGLITSWDGKDDDGKPVPPGKYAARGYAVGKLKVEGKEILGNDWANDDENLRVERITAIALVPEDNGLAILGFDPLYHEEVARYGGNKIELVWQKTDPQAFAKVGFPWPKCSLTVQADALIAAADRVVMAYDLLNGSKIVPTPRRDALEDHATSSPGKGDTTWKIEQDALVQYAASGEPLRRLVAKADEPVPVAVAASKTADKVYLLEEKKDWQRVRGLAWKETTQEGEKTVSTWDTFFEASIHRTTVPVGPDNQPVTNGAEITLEENPLLPGKPPHLKLMGSFDSKGGYLATPDGLRLRQLSQRAYLLAAKLVKDKTGNDLTFYQSDGAAWDEFSIEGATNIMAFDAGEFEMTADGEKLHTEKAAEPADEP